jgi:DNA-binding NarL/FixJ family response regulator
VTTRQSEREIRHAMEVGARGYLIQGCAIVELIHAVRALGSGLRHIGALAAQRLADSVSGQSLTERENDVLRLLVEGHDNKTIARELEIAMGTVKSHLKTIFQKLDANSRTKVAAVAERRGLLTIPVGAFHGPISTSRHCERRSAIAAANTESLH